MITDNKEIDMKPYIQLLIRRRKVIYYSISLHLIIGFLYILFSTPLYKSYITLYPAGELSDSNNLISDFSGIAETFGFSDLKIQSAYYIPDIINSYSLKRDLVLKKWNINTFDSPINLIDYWQIDNNIKSWLSILKSKVFKNKYSIDPIELDINQAVNVLSNLINVDEESSGLIKVDVYMDDPHLSTEVANFISEYVVEFIESEQRSQANVNREFLDSRVASASLDLNESEEKFTKFLKSHPMSIETPEILQEKSRLIRSIEVNQQVYITLRQQLEIAKIEELKNRLFINSLDTAFPATVPSKPNKLLVLVLIVFFGILTTSFYITLLSDNRDI